MGRGGGAGERRGSTGLLLPLLSSLGLLCHQRSQRHHRRGGEVGCVPRGRERGGGDRGGREREEARERVRESGVME